MGQITDKYDIHQPPLGKGGFGTVYRVTHKHLQQVRALKVINYDKASNKEYNHRFLREAQIAAGISNNHIVQIYDFDITKSESDVSKRGELYYVMEFIEGESLEHYLNEHSGPLPPHLAIPIALQVLDGLTCLHEHPDCFLHRDVSTSNIMLSKTVGRRALNKNRFEKHRQVKLIDLGIAKPLSGTAPSFTKEGRIIAREQYASPEQLQGQQLDTTSDLYSLGIILIEMLTGKHVFGKKKRRAEQGLFVRPLSEIDIDGRIRGDLRDIISKVVADKPSARFTSTRELAESLDRIYSREHEKWRPEDIDPTTIFIGTEKPTPTAEQKKKSIETILSSLDQQRLLQFSVTLCNMELGGDGCSLFLLNENRSDLELRASTVLTQQLGQVWNLTETEKNEASRLCPELTDFDDQRTLRLSDLENVDKALWSLIKGFGLTRWSFQFGRPMIIGDIHEDIRWSSSREKRATPPSVNATAAQDDRIKIGSRWHCELEMSEIGSIALVPFGKSDQGLPQGLLRIVWKKPYAAGLEALDWLKWFSQKILDRHRATDPLTDLLDVGTQLEIPDFGKKLVSHLVAALKAIGCSIFLEVKSTVKRQRVFECIATTGLARIPTDYPPDAPISPDCRLDKISEAKYIVDDSETLPDSLTGHVLKTAEALNLKSARQEYISTELKLSNRAPYGSFSEFHPKTPSLPGGPVLMRPLFFYQGHKLKVPKPVGVIRVVRHPQHEFMPHEASLFQGIADRLSKIITILEYRKATDDIIDQFHEPRRMLDRVPREVCRLLSVQGCSVFRFEHNFLELVATEGKLKEMKSYRISVKKGAGWTSWVALNKKVLLLNDPQRIPDLSPPVPVSHSDEHICEIDDVHKFLAVPIFRRAQSTSTPERDSDIDLREVIGVIRVPRSVEEPEFDEIHQAILVSFASRLSLTLHMTQRAESLQEIAAVALQADGSTSPIEIADQVLKRAADVLVNHLDLGSVRIDETDFSNDENRTVIVVESSGGGGGKPTHLPIKLGQDELGEIEYRGRHDQPVIKRQRDLTKIVADICASALYNKMVFNKIEDLRQGLRRIAEEMTSHHRVEEKLKVIAIEAAKVTRAENVIIHEFLVQKKEFRYTAWGGTFRPRVWSSVNFKPGAIPFAVMSLEEGEFISDARRPGHRLYHDKENNFIVREGIYSVAALPLKTPGLCVGCIFFNYRRNQEFKPAMRQEIMLMAEIAALAIFQAQALDTISLPPTADAEEPDLERSDSLPH